jgi:hypothetical protein
MLTVSDIIHLIQYYYHTQTYEGAASDVEQFRLENLRGAFLLSFFTSRSDGRPGSKQNRFWLKWEQVGRRLTFALCLT